MIRHHPLDVDELSPVLEPALQAKLGAQGRIAGIERYASRYRTSFALEELIVRFEDGASVPIIFKDLNRGSLTPEARAAKPSFLYNPEREIVVYGLLLPEAVPSAPACYASVTDATTGRYWLFIEKVQGVELYQVGDRRVWEDVARWLARMHGRTTTQAWPTSLTRHLIRYDQRLYRTWIERALDHGSPIRRDWPARTQNTLERMADRFEQVAHWFDTVPHTLIHGEFYASNVLVEQRAAGLRVCPVDWEMTGFGPCLLDLAALTAGWSEEDRTAIALAYGEAATEGGWWAPEREVLLSALDASSLYLAAQWLGWARDWSPPSEHAQQWPALLVQLADRLTV
jgi:aminoglycoside phosphotransferase (APT) family kinase protein